MANLGQVIHWVRDLDPNAQPTDVPPPGGQLDQDVLTAFNGFSEDWVEVLAAVQVCAGLN